MTLLQQQLDSMVRQYGVQTVVANLAHVCSQNSEKWGQFKSAANAETNPPAHTSQEAQS